MPQSVFPKDTTEWREWVLNQDHVGYKPGALTARPRCRQSTSDNLVKSYRASFVLYHMIVFVRHKPLCSIARPISRWSKLVAPAGHFS